MPNAWVTATNRTRKTVDLSVQTDSVAPKSMVASVTDLFSAPVPVEQMSGTRWGGTVVVEVPLETASYAVKVRIVSASGISSTITKNVVVPEAPADPYAEQRAALAARSTYYEIPEVNDLGARLPRFEDTGVPLEILYGGQMTVIQGDYTARVDGEVIENLDIRGRFIAAASNVTLRNSRITSGSGFKVDIKDGKYNLRLEYCEIDGAGGQAGVAAQYKNITFFRCYAHDCVDIWRMGWNYHLIECLGADSVDNEAGNHVDIMQTNGGNSPTSGQSSVRNCTLLSYRKNDMSVPLAQNSSFGNACMMIGQENSQLANFTIEGNYLLGGNHPIAFKQANSTRPYTNIVIKHNLLGRYRRHYDVLGNIRQSGLDWQDSNRRVDNAVPYTYPKGQLS